MYEKIIDKITTDCNTLKEAKDYIKKQYDRGLIDYLEYEDLVLFADDIFDEFWLAPIDERDIQTELEYIF